LEWFLGEFLCVPLDSIVSFFNIGGVFRSLPTRC